MSLPHQILIGKSYPIKYGTTTSQWIKNQDHRNNLYHTLQYSHKGAAPTEMNTKLAGHIKTCSKPISTTDSPVLLSFQNSKGSTENYKGTRHSCNNDFILIFDGTSFILEKLSTEAIDMKWDTNALPPPLSIHPSSSTPARKRPRTENDASDKSETPSNSTKKTKTSETQEWPHIANPATSAVDFPKPRMLTRSAELKIRNMAHLDEPDSDESGDNSE